LPAFTCMFTFSFPTLGIGQSGLTSLTFWPHSNAPMSAELPVAGVKPEVAPNG